MRSKAWSQRLAPMCLCTLRPLGRTDGCSVLGQRARQKATWNSPNGDLPSRCLGPFVMNTTETKNVGPFVLNDDPSLSDTDCPEPDDAYYRSCEFCFESATDDIGKGDDWLNMRNLLFIYDGRLSCCCRCFDVRFGV